MDVELTSEEKIDKIRRMREGASARGGRKVIERMTKGTFYRLGFLYLTFLKGKQVNKLAFERAMKAKAAGKMEARMRKHQEIQ